MQAKPKEIRDRPARLNVDEDEAKEADLEYITKPLMKKNLISKGLPAVHTAVGGACHVSVTKKKKYCEKSTIKITQNM